MRMEFTSEELKEMENCPYKFTVGSKWADQLKKDLNAIQYILTKKERKTMKERNYDFTLTLKKDIIVPK
jgi:hypothetical protein